MGDSTNGHIRWPSFLGALTIVVGIVLGVLGYLATEIHAVEAKLRKDCESIQERHYRDIDRQDEAVRKIGDLLEALRKGQIEIIKGQTQLKTRVEAHIEWDHKGGESK